VNKIIVSDAEILSTELDAKILQFEKVVILGCSGMLGSYFSNVISHYYSKRNSSRRPFVFGVSRNLSKRCGAIQENFPGVFKQIVYSELPELLRKAGNALVIHCASPSSIQEIDADPIGAVFTNLEVTSTVARHLSNSGGHITFLSTGEVYGDSAPTPTREIDYSVFNHLSARGAYPELKKSAEVILDSYSRAYPEITATSLRVFHTFGPGLRIDDPRIFGIVCKAIIEKAEINLNSDGSTVRTFMYSRDLLSAILKTIGIPKFEAYNAAGNDSMSILDFCNLSLKHGVPKVNLNFSLDSVPRNLQVGLADTSKLRALGWQPAVSTPEALERTFRSLTE